MSKEGSFLRNILSSTAGSIVGMLVTLFLSPFVVHSLGKSVYGIWTLVVSLTGYYGLLDLGIRAAVGQYVTRYWAKRDIEGVNRTMSTAFVLMGGVAALAAAATIFVSFTLERWVQVDPAELASARWAMLVAGFGVALTFPMAIFSSVTWATQRIDIDNAIGIADRLLVAALTVLVLKQGYGVLGLAIVTNGVILAGNLLRIVVAHRLLPGLSIRPRLFSKVGVREIAGYGSFVVIIIAAEKVVIYSDAVVIGIFMKPEAITYYSVGANFIPYLMSLVTSVIWTFTPYAIACDARGEHDKMRQLLARGTRGTLFLASLVGGGLILLGTDFLRLWMGEEFVSGVHYPSSGLILAVLAVAAIIRSGESTGRQILYGMRRQRLLALLACAEMLINLVCSLLLVQSYGILGVAIGTLVAMIVVQGVTGFLVIVRLLKLDWKDYVLQGARGCLPILAAMTLVFLWIDPLLLATSWPRMVVKILIVASPCLIVGPMLAMTRDERQAALRRLLLRRQESATG